MRILAIETATSMGSIALLDGAAVVTQLTEAVPQRHLEWLAPAIQLLLEQAGWRAPHVEAVAVSVGPGTFTGLRIGIVTAATWARARDIPVAGVSTLAALAQRVDAAGLICAMLDARRGEVAAALFRRNETVTRVTDDIVAPVADVLAQLPAREPITFAGDALTRYADTVLSHRPDGVLAPRDQWWPTAVAVGRLARERLARGERDDPYLLRPVYVRLPTDKGKYGTEG